MNALRLLKSSLTALLLSALLAACASGGDTISGTPAEVEEIQTQLLGDMPLPQGAKISNGESLIIGRGDSWVGRVVLNGLQTPTDIYAFFQSEYPKSGWTTISAVKAKTSILVFSKADRTATVEINDGTLGGPKSLITVTVSPKKCQRDRTNNQALSPV